MNAYDVARLIEDIADTPSRTEKERLVGHLAASEIGLFVIKWAYDPFITYGVTPALSEGIGRFDFRPSLVEPLLKKLASRELTGLAAEREIGEVMQMLNKDGARLLFLILSKDLKCGIAASTINSAAPGTIPVFSVQRAIAYELKRLKPGKTYKGEFKLDGQRNTFLMKDNHGGFFTRSGQRVPALDFMVPVVMQAASYAVSAASPELRNLLKREGEDVLNFMLDGEAMMGLFEETGALRRKDVDAIGAELHLYDIQSYDDFNAVGAVGLALSERRKLLQEFVKLAKVALAPTPNADVIQIVPQFFVNNDAEVQELFQRARSMTLAKYLARGDAEKEAELEKTTIDKATGKPKVLEGIVVKDMDALYEKKKSAAWMKLKNEETEDLRITGAYPGEPHTKYAEALGGVEVDFKGVTVNVGGGFSDDERFQLWADFTGKPTFRTYKNADGNDQVKEYTPSGPLVGRLLEVEFMEITPDGSLRHPRAVRFRDDKDGELEERAAA